MYQLESMGQLEQVLKQCVNGEPSDLRNYLSVVRADTLYASGTTVPLLGQRQYKLHRSGLLVPASLSDPGPLDYAYVYVVLEDYIDMFPAASPKARAEHSFEFAKGLTRLLPFQELITLLAALDHLALRPEQLQVFQNEYAQHVAPRYRALLETAMQDQPGGPQRRFLSRQAILSAMQMALCSDYPDIPDHFEIPPMAVAVLMTHALASSFVPLDSSDEELGSTPKTLGIDLIQNQLFYEPMDVRSLVDQQTRLWKKFGTKLKKTSPRRSPAELFYEAAGIELEDFMAFGFALYAHAATSAPDRSLWTNDDFNSDRDPSVISNFLDLVAATKSDLSSRVEASEFRWDYMDILTTPVLRNGDHLLVLDEEFLLDRVFNGPYWIVHEHERRTHGAAGWKSWTQIYGEMVELMVEDQLRAITPKVLGLGGTYFTEEDFSTAYQGKVCDAAIHFGSRICLIEIVSGQITRGTRFEGRSLSFEADTEKMVMKKARQLHESAASVLNDEGALTGCPPTSGLRIVPIIVVSGGYPVNPISMAYIKRLILEERLFEDARIAPLSIISIVELEMLEGLSTFGVAMPDALLDWQSSSLSTMPLSNYLIHRYNDLNQGDFRPARMAEVFEATCQDILTRLKLRS